MQNSDPTLNSLSTSNVRVYRRILDHPGLRVFELTLGLLGVILAVFFYYQSRFRKEPYFYVDQTRNILVNRELAIGEKLSVTFEGRPAQHGDITAMQCYFWNAGRAPIHDHEILQPIKLRLDPGNEILDVSVIRQSRPDIMQFRIAGDRNPDGTSSNTATISFKILEQNDGVSVQILYAGGPQTPVSFSGTIEGATIRRLPRPLDAFRDSGSRESELRKTTQEFFVFLFLLPILFPLALMLTVIKGLGAKTAILALKKEILDRCGFWLISVLWLVCVSVTYYYLFYFYPGIPQDVLS